MLTDEFTELREQILNLLLVRPSTTFCYKNKFPWDKRNSYFRNMLSIMLVCRQFRQEAKDVFFRHNQFIFYSVNKPDLPAGLRLDKHWFTKHPVPIRKLTLGEFWETPQLIANCPELKYLRIMGAAPNLCHDVAAEQEREAWILQYRTNLARLLGRRNGCLRLEGNKTFFEIVEIIGCGDPVDTWEVLELIDELRDGCRGVALLSKWKSSYESEEEVGAWIVRIGYTQGGVVTAKLVRRRDDFD
jgi:hypothetical protein